MGFDWRLLIKNKVGSYGLTVRRGACTLDTLASHHGDLMSSVRVRTIDHGLLPFGFPMNYLSHCVLRLVVRENPTDISLATVDVGLPHLVEINTMDIPFPLDDIKINSGWSYNGCGTVCTCDCSGVGSLVEGEWTMIDKGRIVVGGCEEAPVVFRYAAEI
ncbi:hypothetical protein L6452_40609 [Arctium lappa]|uniref:Uncharacterized protein n=1 Tax=Arctium lappa TaxID=4217 RepID=A0ACB8XMM4_ARCLA|nr:hypothetical protein L6452_40609 [Arctium lappa]